MKIGTGSAYNAFDQWSDAVHTTPQWGAAQSLTTTPTAITLEYFEATGNAGVTLWVRNPAGLEFEVPASWFDQDPDSAQRVESSTVLAGAASVYASARVSEELVVLTDVSGTAHTYVKKSTGGYEASVGEYGVLSLDARGQVVLSEADGTVYTFNAQGDLASATSAADAHKPATPIVHYRQNGLVDRISDPVSLVPSSNPATYTREVRFAYAGDSGLDLGLSLDPTAGSACAVPNDYAQPPAGMLCRIFYPDQTDPDETTRILYDTNGKPWRSVIREKKLRPSGTTHRGVSPGFVTLWRTTGSGQDLALLPQLTESTSSTPQPTRWRRSPFRHRTVSRQETGRRRRTTTPPRRPRTSTSPGSATPARCTDTPVP